MIAVTDISALTDWDAATEAPALQITTDLVNDSLTGSVIINTVITTAVRNLLISILNSTSTMGIKSEISQIATYAGFTMNNTGVITFNSSNFALDKLTFYVIFRLPNNSGLQYEDPLPDSSVTPGNVSTKWGKYANYIRGLNGSGIKRINSSGEQVNASGKPIDDNNNDLAGWYTEAAYNFLGEHPFNGSFQVPPGLFSAQTEKAMLFGQNTNVPNAPGELPLPITKIPLYFYLLGKVENPYNSTYWLNPNKASTTISRVCHWPAKVTLFEPRVHFVKLLSNPSNIEVADGTYGLLNDSSGTYFLISVASNPTKQKLYVAPLDNESLSFEGLLINGASQMKKTSDGYLAVWTNKYNNPTLSNDSGLTSGVGLDIGAGMDGVYSVIITMTITGTGTFRLYYGGSRTAPISANIDTKSLSVLITNLIQSPGRVAVVKKKSTDPFTITITREYASNNLAYKHRLYPFDFTGNVNIVMDPLAESAIWIERPSVINNAFYFLRQYLNHNFSNNPIGIDYWRTQITTLSETQKDQLLSVLKKSSGCRSKAGYYLWDENKDLLKNLEFKSYTQNLRSMYNFIFLPKYYNRTKIIGDNTVKQNAINTTVQDLLNSSRLKTVPNQAELFAIVLLNYNFPGLYKKRINKLIDAINIHSKSMLINAMSGLSKDRITALRNFCGTTVITKLYHGIDD